MFVVRAPTRDLAVLLAGVEGAPLRAAVDLALVDDEAAVVTDRLAVFLVGDQVARTLRAGRRRVLFLRLVRASRSRSGVLVAHCTGQTLRAGRFLKIYRRPTADIPGRPVGTNIMSSKGI